MINKKMSSKNLNKDFDKATDKESLKKVKRNQRSIDRANEFLAGEEDRTPEFLNEILQTIAKEDDTDEANGYVYDMDQKYEREEKGQEIQRRLQKMPNIYKARDLEKCCVAIVFEKLDNGERFGRQCKKKVDPENTDQLCKTHACHEPEYTYNNLPQGIKIMNEDAPKIQTEIETIFKQAIDALRAHKINDNQYLETVTNYFKKSNRRKSKKIKDSITEQVKIGVSQLTDELLKMDRGPEFEGTDDDDDDDQYELCEQSDTDEVF